MRLRSKRRKWRNRRPRMIMWIWMMRTTTKRRKVAKNSRWCPITNQRLSQQKKLLPAMPPERTLSILYLESPSLLPTCQSICEYNCLIQSGQRNVVVSSISSEKRTLLLERILHRTLAGFCKPGVGIYLVHRRRIFMINRLIRIRD